MEGLAQHVRASYPGSTGSNLRAAGEKMEIQNLSQGSLVSMGSVSGLSEKECLNMSILIVMIIRKLKNWLLNKILKGYLILFCLHQSYRVKFLLSILFLALGIT